MRASGHADASGHTDASERSGCGRLRLQMADTASEKGRASLLSREPMPRCAAARAAAKPSASRWLRSASPLPQLRPKHIATAVTKAHSCDQCTTPPLRPKHIVTAANKAHRHHCDQSTTHNCDQSARPWLRSEDNDASGAPLREL